MFNLFKKKEIKASKHPKFQNPEVSGSDAWEEDNIPVQKQNEKEQDMESQQQPELPLFRYHTNWGIPDDAALWDEYVLSCCEYVGYSATIKTSNVSPLCRKYVLKPNNLDSKGLIRQREKLCLIMEQAIEMVIRPDGAVDMIIPHLKPAQIFFGDIWENGDFSGTLPVAVGYDMDGKPVVTDLAKLPHLLVAGQTGGGKSILLHGMICSLLLKSDADLILVDPKMVELSYYQKLDRVRMVTETLWAVDLLAELCQEMDARYQMLCAAGCRDIDSYNQAGGNMKRKVLIIDELADLMETSGALKRTICSRLQRIGQKARACGIHMILCTQSPRKEVLPGIIKANIPAKICLRTSTQRDSMVILDRAGGEKLNGHGHMIFDFGNEAFQAQSGLITEQEIANCIYACLR